MGSFRQKKLAQAIVKGIENGGKETAKDMLVKVGYAINTAEVKSKEIIEQKGVQEELAKLGFDPENAKRVVGEILNSGEDPNRLKAADMIFKVNGSYAPEKSINVNVSMIDDKAIQDLANELNSKMLHVHERPSISSNGIVPSSMAEEVRDENGERNTA